MDISCYCCWTVKPHTRRVVLVAEENKVSSPKFSWIGHWSILMRSFEDYEFIDDGKVSRELLAKMLSKGFWTWCGTFRKQLGKKLHLLFFIAKPPSALQDLLCKADIFSVAVVSISLGDGAYAKLGLFSGNLSLDRQYSAKLFWTFLHSFWFSSIVWACAIIQFYGVNGLVKWSVLLFPSSVLRFLR